MENLSEQFIFFCWAAGILYWIIKAFSVKKTIQSQSWLLYRITTLVIAVVVIALIKYGTNLPYYSYFVLWNYTPPLGIVADAITLVGLLTLLWARTTLGRNWSDDIVL